MISYEEFQDNLKDLEQQIEAACAECGRNSKTVSILPVTKTFPKEAIEYAHRAGFKAIGENKVQEALQKKEIVTVPIQWELIGHLQSNKVNLAVKHFDRIQSVDSIKLLAKIDQAAKAEGKKTRILVQVNAGNDPAKFGLAMGDTPSFFKESLRYEHVTIEGLMTIAPLDQDSSVAQKAFRNLRLLREQLSAEFDMQLPELSMGMTSDLKEAIQEGSTMIRVGTGLFGKRVT